MNPAVVFTEAEDRYILAHFTTDMRVEKIADKLGRTMQAVYSRARKLGLKRTKGEGQFSDFTHVVMKLAARPGGVSNEEVPGRPDAASTKLGKLAKRGHLYRVQVSPRRFRYFATQAAADAFVVPAIPKPHTGVVIKASLGPAYLPGEPIRTKHTKFTRCPSPGRVLYSNTHPRY